MAKTACSRTIDIPELFDFISSYLSTADLLTCVQVNSQWHHVFIPKLWHTIDDTQNSWKRVLLGCQNRSLTPPLLTVTKKELCLRGAFTKYGQFIRKLRVHSSLLVDIASVSGMCIQITDLEVDLSGSRSDGWLNCSASKFTLDHCLLSGDNADDCYNDGDFENVRNLDWVQSTLEATPDLPVPGLFGYMEPARFKDVFESPAKSRFPYMVAITEEELREGLVLTQRYWSLILANPGLHRLHLTGHCALQWRVQSTDFFFKVLSTLKELRDLCACEHVQLNQLWRLYEVAPSVETVTVPSAKGLFGVGGSITVNDDHPRQAMKNPAIKTLRIARAFTYDTYDVDELLVQFCGPTLQDALATLSQLPNLENLTMMDYADDNNYNITSFFSSSITSSHAPLPTPLMALPPPELGSTLKTLYVSERSSFIGINFVTELAPLLRQLPNLQELRTNNLTHESVKALATRCKALEVLEWIRDPTFHNILNSSQNHKNVHLLLVSCPKLRVFKGVDQHVNANDMIREPLACQMIEIFRCRIVGVVRLTKDEQTTLNNILASHPTFQRENDAQGVLSTLSEKERAVVQKCSRSREQQRQVYERLASLQCLKHLDIGFEIQEYLSHEPRRTLDTLELTLESGLGQLGSLKNLEMFGFEGVDYRIDKKELEWMAKKWPELKLMHGLTDEHCEKKHMRAFRPDIVHVSFFRFMPLDPWSWYDIDFPFID
ncbi:MAG: hypothetical protein J3Q66DRAFT_401313 [Benniella sp.]|nr:MAG: hypothetical protein J3Q66DRAFT_401313 [Benniella sp.]